MIVISKDMNIKSIYVSAYNWLNKNKPLKAGWYFVQSNGKAEPARFAGKFWFKNGTALSIEPTIVGIRKPIALSCPTGCKCNQNPDGTWNVNCT